MGFAGSELKDLKLGKDREVVQGADQDLKLTSGVETVEQSVGIKAGQALRPLIGEPTTTQNFVDVEEELAEVIEEDPQVDTVLRVNIVEVNRQQNSVTVEVFTSYNNSFTIEPTV